MSGSDRNDTRAVTPRSPAVRVLLVENDEAAAAAVRACLDDAGTGPDSVLWERTLADALRAHELHRPECVLLSLDLPDVDGVRALAQIVSVAPDTPVIVLNDPGAGSGTQLLAEGAEDYLVKNDLTPELLNRSIRYSIERKRSQRTRRQLRQERLTSAERSRLERGLLPSPLLRGAPVRCSTYYQPGRDHAVLGGDFFDVVEVPGGRLRLVIGDVMGHGPDEAALGVHLRVAWRTLVLAGLYDEAVLPTLSSVFAAEAGGQAGFVTACDITIEPGGSVTLRVAGHPAPLVHLDGKTTYLDVRVGPPLGLESLVRAAPDSGASVIWPPTKTSLTAGASLILYTDGLLDAYAPAPGRTDGDGTGVAELIEAVDRTAAQGSEPAAWIRSLVTGAPRESVDDTAIVVVAPSA